MTHLALELTTVTSQGGLLPLALLKEIAAASPAIPGADPASYHFASSAEREDAISRAFQVCTQAWDRFWRELETLPVGDTATALTRDRWLLPLFETLGFGRLGSAAARSFEGKTFALSHIWRSLPIHLLGAGVDLDKRQKGVRGAAVGSPHGLIQELLNKDGSLLWALVSNGRQLRLLRDSKKIARLTFVEFDLELMFRGSRFADFRLLWLCCHESRFEADRVEDFWIERWSQEAQLRGTRALDTLRDGVRAAIQVLGSGFLAHPKNEYARAALRSGQLSRQDYYRHLLRLVYRLLFLLVAEDRDLLLDPKASEAARSLYDANYSTARLRRLASKVAGTRHGDLWRQLLVIMQVLGTEAGIPALGLLPLGSFLWQPSAIGLLVESELENAALLEALRALCFTEQDGRLVPVDWRNLSAEEFGSIYESLLELHAQIELDAQAFVLDDGAGNERKTTGSYYTPDSLVQALLDSALDPVVQEARQAKDPEKALLALKVCDPACGSGHFLIAAARRIAKALASVRSGDEEPAPEMQRHALRDVVAHSIYGVDLNPMAVELCKVNLWLESLEPGRPLSFLEHRIQCGNSLLGATPTLLRAGIPDAAFEPIEGDDKEFCKKLRNDNKAARRGQLLAVAQAAEQHLAWGARLRQDLGILDATPDLSVRGVVDKERQYQELLRSAPYRDTRLLADLWCAAFVWSKRADAAPPPTQDLFQQVKKQQRQPLPQTVSETERLRDEFRFFHWHIAFPEIFDEEGNGGFNVVLGNPPWEHTELKEKEFFASRDSEIASASSGASRKAAIAELAKGNQNLHAEFLTAKRSHDAVGHVIRESGRFPLCARGRVNTYAIFSELSRSLVASTGRVGIIVPSGIATDDTTKHFFQALIEDRSLVSFYDFENNVGYFPGVGHGRFKFVLMTLTGRDRPIAGGTDFVFFAHRVEDLEEQDRHFTLSAEDIALLNPNTKTCPVFRSKRDAEITKAIYRRVPVLWDENRADGNPWGLQFKQGLFNMTSDSDLFRTQQQLLADGWKLAGNRFVKGRETMLPLYEAKMIHHFNHRYGDYRDHPEGSQNTHLPEVPLERLQDPSYEPLSRYWVPAQEVDDSLRKTDKAGRVTWEWKHDWLLGWRDITNSTNERTVIASVIPRVGAGNQLPLMFLSNEALFAVPVLIGALSSFVCDFAARQKVGGTHLNFFIYEQLPVPSPELANAPASWARGTRVVDWVAERVLELCSATNSLRPFTMQFGGRDRPLPFDEARRFRLRCELDAAFFHLYGLTREDVLYVMDCFPIVRRNDEKEHGEFRTKRVVMECFDDLGGASK